MGRSPCCNKVVLKKGPWTPEEDQKLIDYIQKHGHGRWRALPNLAGLNRCGKSCRLRWSNYLSPDIKRGNFSEEEDGIIIHLHSVLGNKWSLIAANLPGRTDNDIKNYWNSHLRKKLLRMGIDPITHRPRADLNLLVNLPHLLATASRCNLMNPWDNALRIRQVIDNGVPPHMEAVNLLGSTLFQDFQLSQYLQSNTQYEWLHNNPLDPVLDPTQMHSNFSSLGVPQPPSECHHIITKSGAGLEGGPSSYAIRTVNLVPASVSVSPQCSTVDQMESKIIPFDISAPSSTLTNFEAWGELNVDDCFWTDIID